MCNRHNRYFRIRLFISTRESVEKWEIDSRMVSVTPLHRTAHFDPTEGAAYAVATIAPQVRVTPNNAASIFEILLADQVSVQGSKNAASTSETGHQDANSSDGQLALSSAGSTIRSNRELTIADIQSNRLGFNFARAMSSTAMNSPEEILNAVAASTPDAATKAVLSQEFNAIASSVQRLIPQSMIAFEELAAEPAGTSVKTATPTTQQSSNLTSKEPDTMPSIPNPVGQNSPVIRGPVISARDFQAASVSTKIGATDAAYSINMNQSHITSTAPQESSVNTVVANGRVVESVETNTSQSQNFSERLSTAVADTLGQMANGGPTSVSIRLTLPELGIVVLYLSLANGAVSVRIGVKNSRAKRTLESQLNDLRSALLERDVNCDECQVDDESEGQHSAESAADDQHYEAAKPSNLSRWTSSPVASSVESGAIGAGQLNFTA